MNTHLQHILDTIQQIENLSDEQLAAIIHSLKDADKEMTITEFKLDRTEKVKRTTAILLEETIEELEQKRKAVEEANEALKKSLEELKAAQTQLIHAEKMASLGELTAGIAHEIKNPLNFVNNFSEVSHELLQEMKEELDQGHYEDAAGLVQDVIGNLEKILYHGTRADGIVRSMLQHSRSGTGDKEPTDINALCDEYLRLAYHGLRAKDKSFNADFKTDFDEALPKINVVPQDIGRVLLNLINNAFYACTERSNQPASAIASDGQSNQPASAIASDGQSNQQSTISNQQSSPGKEYKPMVTVTTRQNNEMVIIIVRDNGPGIPDNIRDKIFQPFFTTKPTGEGTGLGLSLAYDIVTKGHGGQLSVETEQGRGTQFIIQLPVN